jgi:hypothetical protein
MRRDCGEVGCCHRGAGVIVERMGGCYADATRAESSALN